MATEHPYIQIVVTRAVVVIFEFRSFSLRSIAVVAGWLFPNTVKVKSLATKSMCGQSRWGHAIGISGDAITDSSGPETTA